MFHVSTVPGVHASPWRSGHPAFIMRRFELEGFLKGIEEHRINELGMVPPLVLAIVMSPLSKKYSLRSIKKVGAGAAPLDAALQNRFKALCAPDAVFTQVLGMTESTGAYTLFYYPEDDETGSIGKFIPNIEHKWVLHNRIKDLMLIGCPD
jgi:4-coumarate--CoA ligase